MYVVLVAAANLCLGYAVGVYLGFGPRAVGELEIVMPSQPAPASSDAAAPAGRSPAASESLVDDAANADAEDGPEPALDASDQQAANDKSDVENALEDLLESRAFFHRQLVTIHDHLRTPAETIDKATVAKHLRDLKNIGAKYLKTTSADLERFAERTGDKDDLADFCEAVQRSVGDHVDFVEQSQGELANFDLNADPAGGCEQLLQMSCRLINATYQLRDHLVQASIELARQEGRLGNHGIEAPLDELTQIPNREAAEAGLEDFWRKDPHRQRDMTVALIDLDEFQRVNAAYGTAVGDRLIKAVARLVSAAVPRDDLAARFQGQRFVVLFPDNLPRHATAVVEAIRQTIEETTFQQQDTALRITASCAVSPCTDNDDTAEPLFARLAKTLQEAKRYGRNRTFLHEGKYPAPVVPPNLDIQSQKVEI